MTTAGDGDLRAIDPELNYDRWYARGGFPHDPARHRRALRQFVIDPLKLKPPATVIDIGCGMGLHTRLWSEQGFECTGVDASAVGIAQAQQRHPGCRFLRADAADLSDHFAPASLDVIFARGMSWWHYELNCVNRRGVDVPQRTRELFEFLRQDGLFILQIKTDFSGRQDRQSSVLHNRREEYFRLFAPLGQIVLATDWRGRPVRTDAQAAKSRNNIIIATRKE